MISDITTLDPYFSDHNPLSFKINIKCEKRVPLGSNNLVNKVYLNYATAFLKCSKLLSLLNVIYNPREK